MRSRSKSVNSPDDDVELKKLSVKTPHVIVGLYAFNAENLIAQAILKARIHADTVIVCDDGSTDLTATVAEGLGATVIRHDRNRGLGPSIRTIFELARDLGPDAVIIMDIASSWNAESIPKYVVPITTGEADVVFESNETRNSTSNEPSGISSYSKEALNTYISGNADNFESSLEWMDYVVEQGLKVKVLPSSSKQTGDDPPERAPPPKPSWETPIRGILEGERPLKLLGIPGVVAFLGGILSGLYVIRQYLAFNYISIPVTLLTFMGMGIGGLLIVSALILFSINRNRPNIREKD